MNKVQTIIKATIVALGNKNLQNLRCETEGMLKEAIELLKEILKKERTIRRGA